jgi:hypothetical protein
MVEQVAMNTDETLDTPTQENSSTTNDRPSWLPEKFNNAEELAKAYGELEKSYSSKQTEEAPPVTQQEAEQATGLSLDSYYNEYAENGQLSDDSYKKLETSGLSKDLVDSYIEGQTAIADNHVRQIQSSAGGETEYTKITEWASQNLPEAEVTTFNKIVESGTVEEAMMAVSGLKARYDNTVGVTPNLIQCQVSAPSSAYQSTAEIVSAINDPRYKVDTAYRKTVEDKIKRSNVLG